MVIITSLVVLIGIDWFHRVFTFRWHERLLGSIAVENRAIRGPLPPTNSITMSADRRGDLVALTGIPEMARPYAHEREAYELVTDEFGYPNQPPTDHRFYPVVTVGDSYFFMSSGPEGDFARFLERKLGFPVYNHAYPGRGAFWGLQRFLEEGRFTDRMPKVLVWGCLERELAGALFAGFVYQIWKMENPDQAELDENKPMSVRWSALAPATLRTSLPDSSWLAARANQLWNRIRYEVFGQLTEDVVIAESDEKPSRLFYRLSLESLTWTPEERNSDQVAWAIERIHAYCRQRGTQLLIVLIPDKERVYQREIPADWVKAHGPLHPSVLPDVEKALLAKEVPVVNLLPIFQSAADRGRSVYWGDDTHWRAEGMRLAAEPIGNTILKLIGESMGAP
jgi:hypothetical protein